MPIRIDCSPNMNTYIRLSGIHAGVTLFAILLLAGCTGRKQQAESAPPLLEKEAIESALSSFAKDWGMPSHPEVIPKTCYLRNTYAPVQRDEIAAALALASEDGERQAVAAITSGQPEEVLTASSLPCKLSRPQEIDKIESGGHIYPGAVIIVSHVGFDNRRENAALLLGEARGDLSGSTWIIFLRKSATGWSVLGRHLLKRS